MSEIASAYVSLLPSFRGGKSAITRELGGPLSSAGVDGGRRFGTGMKSGIAGIAGKVFAPLAAAAAGVAVGGFLKGAISQASDLSESVNALNVTYGEASEGVQQLGKSAAESLGLSNLEFNNLAVRFSAFTKTIAGDGGDVVGTLDDLTTRASDFASVMNLEVAEAAQLFQSGLAGESEPLRKFGIDMSAAAVTAYALENGIASSAGAMTEAQKQQARYGLLMEQTSETQGDFANTSDQLANQQRILSSRWKDLSAGIGALFLPAVSGAVSFINSSVMPALDTAVTGITGLVDLIVRGDFTGALNEAFGWEEDSGIVDSLLNIREGIMAGFADGGLIGAAQAAFQMLVDWLANGGITMILDGLLSGRQRLLDAAMQLFPAILDAAVTFIPELVGWLGGTLIPTVVDFVISAVPMLLESALMLFGSLVDAIIQVLPLVGGAIVELLPQLTEAFLIMLPELLSAAITLFLAIVDAVLLILPQLLGILLGTVLPSLIEALLTMIPELLGAAVQVFLALLDAVLTVLPQLVELLFTDVIPAILDALITMGPQLLETALRAFLELLEGIIRALPLILGFLVRDLIPAVVRTILGLGGRLLTAGGDIMAKMLRGLVGALPAILRWFGGLGSNIARAVGNLGRWLFGAGRAIIKGLIDGIMSMFGSLKNTVSNVLGAVRDFFPFSPAKDGPFSGRGWVLYSGQAISEALAAGIEGGGSDVVSASQRVMDAASSAFTRAPVGIVGAVAGQSRAPGVLEVRDVDGGLIGRMRVEAGGVQSGRVSPLMEGRPAW